MENDAQAARESLTPEPEQIGEGELQNLPECDCHDCDDSAPFTVQTDSGPVHRCRTCLRRDLAADWWRFEEAEA